MPSMNNLLGMQQSWSKFMITECEFQLPNLFEYECHFIDLQNTVSNKRLKLKTCCVTLTAFMHWTKRNLKHSTNFGYATNIHSRTSLNANGTLSHPYNLPHVITQLPPTKNSNCSNGPVWKKTKVLSWKKDLLMSTLTHTSNFRQYSTVKAE